MKYMSTYPRDSRSSRRLCSNCVQQQTYEKDGQRKKYCGRVRPALFLTDADVRVDTRVTGSASKVFVLAVRDVLMATGVPVLFGEAEVDDVHHILPLAQPNLDDAKTNHQVLFISNITVSDSRSDTELTRKLSGFTSR